MRNLIVSSARSGPEHATATRERWIEGQDGMAMPPTMREIVSIPTPPSAATATFALPQIFATSADMLPRHCYRLQRNPMCPSFKCCHLFHRSRSWRRRRSQPIAKSDEKNRVWVPQVVRLECAAPGMPG